VGSAERFNYSAIGDAVNVAARAEAACKELGYDLVICRSTADQAPDFAFLDAGSIQLKGKTDRVSLTILVGDSAMKASPEFEAFSAIYRVLTNAMSDGSTPIPKEALAECVRLAEGFDSRLAYFVERIPARRKDFQIMPDRHIELVSVE
jgi:adenylate cyclase